MTGIVLLIGSSDRAAGQNTDHTLRLFERQQLSDVYFSEGASAGDINSDGIADVVCGPYWYAGPEFEQRFEIYAPAPQDREGYADHFFCWVYDFDADRDADVFTVGFPGTTAYVYENPGDPQSSGHWPKHEVFDWVSNESPHLTDLVGDERPELVCTRDGFFGFASIDWDHPLEPWTFHPISDQIAAPRFGHGLGVGDVNGDGLQDVLHSAGWFEQPAQDALESRWRPHEATFTDSYGGAEMYAYDVDGDGDNDIITSLAAHDFGLAWFEQHSEQDERTFERHLIMGDHPADSRYGVLFTELHSVNLADIDGDGLRDIITGKTFYSHHRQSPMWDAGAVVYWFRLVRNEDGVDWVPYRADDQAGIGRQVSVADLNDDGLPDVVVGGMKGAHVLIQREVAVDRDRWLAAQPKRYQGPPRPSAEGAQPLRGPEAPVDAETGVVPEGLEGESLEATVSAGQIRPQEMDGFPDGRWSGGRQLFWTGGRPGDRMTVPLPALDGVYDLELVLTCARDYAIVQISVDGEPAGPPIDCFEPRVLSSGVLTFEGLSFDGAPRSLEIQIVGANEQAVRAFMVGLDYLRLRESR